MAFALHPGTDHRLGATFAIGARQMHHRRQAVLRITQSRQQSPNPIQVQINDLGMQRHHPLKDDVRRFRCHVV